MITKQQKEILDFAKEKGFVSLTDKFRFYSTEFSFQNAMQRLINLGYLEVDKNVLGKFNYRGDSNRSA